MTEHIEVFYTGGGITLAEVDIDRDRYAVVSTDAPDFLTVYTTDDGEKSYLPDDMLTSTSKEKLPPELKALHAKMVEKLKTA